MKGGYQFFGNVIEDTYETIYRKFNSKFPNEEIKEAESQLEDENYTSEWVEKE